MSGVPLKIAVLVICGALIALLNISTVAPRMNPETMLLYGTAKRGCRFSDNLYLCAEKIIRHREI